MLAESLTRELRSRRSALAQETKLHEAIADALRALKWQFTQEHRLNAKSRLDFMLNGGIAIEVKKGKAGLAEMQQIGRYLEHPAVTGCIVIALRCDSRLPATFLNKPVVTIELWRMLL